MIYPFLDYYAGGSIYFMECIKRWKKNNDITIYAVTYDKDVFADYDVDVDVKIMDVPFKKEFMRIPLIFQHRIAEKYIEKHEIFNSHTFPCHSFNIENNIWTAHDPSRILYDLSVLIKKESLPKRILYNSTAPFLRKIDKSNYRASITIANSNYSKPYFEEVYGNIDVEVVYPGVDFKKYNKEKIEKNKNLIVCASRIFDVKRFDLAIKALQYLDEETHLVIIGEGPYKNNLIKLSQNLKLENRVTFKGFVSDKKLIEYYKKALCTVFLPYNELFGMVALESLAAGTPVIGKKNGGGYTELINEGENGFLIDYNPKVIAEKIRYMQENETTYKKMVQNCINTAKNHTWNHTANQTMKIFEKQLNK